MKIVYKDTFVVRLESQLKYIAKNSPKCARKLKTELFQRIKEIPETRIYFENQSTLKMS